MRYDSCTLLFKLFCRCALQRHPKLMVTFVACVNKYGPDVRKWVDSEARTCLLSVILHLADISNVARPIAEALLWAVAVTQGE